MELRINSNVSEKIEKVSNVMELTIVTIDNELIKDTLNGTVLVEGKYITDNLDDIKKFSKKIPYTVVLNEEDYVLDDVRCENLEYNVIVGNGIECSFDMIIKYNAKETKDSSNSTSNIEVLENNFMEAINNSFDDDCQEVPVEIINNDEVKEENDIESEIEIHQNDIKESENDFASNVGEEVKEEITQKYDELLEDILQSREDNFLEEIAPEVKVSTKDSDDNSIFRCFRECYSSYHVYYPKEDKELEEICKKENVSIDKVYKDNKNNGYNENRRIIIK